MSTGEDWWRCLRLLGSEEEGGVGGVWGGGGGVGGGGVGVFFF